MIIPFCHLRMGGHKFLFYGDNSPDTLLILPELLNDMAQDPELPNFTTQHASIVLVSANRMKPPTRRTERNEPKRTDFIGRR